MWHFTHAQQCPRAGTAADMKSGLKIIVILAFNVKSIIRLDGVGYHLPPFWGTILGLRAA
jgi:hypothetical protein